MLTCNKGPGGFDLYDRLTLDGVECIVTPPSLIPTASDNRVKTDKKDSLKLAKLLESNMLKKIWVLEPEERAHRQLVRTRRQIVNHRSDVMRQIKSLLLFHSIAIPFPSDQLWSGAFIKWLHDFDRGDEYLNRSCSNRHKCGASGKMQHCNGDVHSIEFVLNVKIS